MTRVRSFAMLIAAVSLAASASEATVVPTGPPVPVVLPMAGASATLEQGGFPASEVVDGIINGANNGWAISGSGSTQNAVFQTAGAPVFGAGGSRLSFEMEYPRLDRHTIGHMRWYATTDSSPTAANIGTTNWVPLTPISAVGTSGETWLISPASDAFGDLSPNRILWDPNQGIPGTTGPAEILTVVADAPPTLTGITGFRMEAIVSPGIFQGTGDLNGPGLTSANGNFVFSELGLTSQVLAVPEPSAAMLFGLAVVPAIRRRRKLRSRRREV